MDDFFSKYVSKEAAQRYSPSPSRPEKNKNMKNQSELGKRGYSTSLPRTQRRAIIKLTIDDTSILEVVNILVMNTKRAKTKQILPINAIRIWEADLEWIKETFWKGQFQWPDYSRLGS